MGIENGYFFTGSPEVHSNGDTKERQAERQSWLSEIINPEQLVKAMKHRSNTGHSPEWVIMNALIAKKIEQGPELDATIRTRLTNLIGILRIAFYPNMTEGEQDFIRRLVAETTTVDFSALQYEVTPKIREDVQWLWNTFNLTIPTKQQNRGLLPAVSATIDQLGLTAKPTDK